MKHIFCMTAFILLLSCASKPQTQTAKTEAPKTPPFLTDIRQMSFAGVRAGEGYFSQDGRYMIFQSEREEANPFYQIYLLDLAKGTSRRISPGSGKTTCAWIHPDNKRVLFSSTHADPLLKKKVAEEIESRKAPKNKYSWSFDDAFEIYETGFNGGTYKNLTRSPGYDAEGSYSPDGKWIAFASNRRGYTEKLREKERDLFQKDPSSQMDLYLMRADGTQVKRLTTDLGYDGGPFFSPDGKRIVYRHFTEDGNTAEVFTIGIDGSDKKQITHIKAMSWAPFYHPSGDYIIFTSNKFGYQNFELFIIDTDGKHEPVRVTDLAGFDGLPVFTPDGENLVWSHTNERGEAQLFRANWNDALARQALGLPPVATKLKNLATTTPSTVEAKSWVEYLASEKMQGRATGSPQELEYLNKIAESFASYGLTPFNGKSFLQKYEFTSGVDLDEKGANSLAITGLESLTVGKDWIPLSYSQTGSFQSAPIVFAGYGIIATAAGTQPEYNSYLGIDVKDKWVAVFAGLPDDVGNDRRFFLNTFAQIQHKAMAARTQGARGLIILNDALTPSRAMNLTFEGRSEEMGIPVLRIANTVADKLFASAKTTRQEWTKKLSRGETATLTFTPTLSADVHLHFKKSVAYNALGLLKVPGATSTIVIGAHGDHLGHGEFGNSLHRGSEPAIHHGADDNASGVTGVLQIAKNLKRKDLKQNILFAIWSGEEIGILGSNYFLKNLKDMKISAYLNMDMIGRYRDQVMIQGTGSAPEWKKLVESVSVKTPLNVRTQEDPYLPSDALAFYMKGIPVLMAFTGSHSEYHTPKDTADTVNYDGLVQIAQWMEQMTQTLAASSKSLVTYRKVESTSDRGGNRGFRLYLGTVPDYSQDGVNGVLISGTSKDSPAEKSGLIAGDTIVELGGIKIKNLYDYVYCLQALKANQKISMRIVRGGTEKQLEITPIVK